MRVIGPSRGRPQNIAALMSSWYETEAEATLLVAVDDDDPELAGYEDLFNTAHDKRYELVVGPRLRMAGTLDMVAMSRVNSDKVLDTDIIGFMGDDHRPRTPHWDRDIEAVFKQWSHCVVYGNDLLQGMN